jgi:hypothetical protein
MAQKPRQMTQKPRRMTQKPRRMIRPAQKLDHWFVQMRKIDVFLENLTGKIDEKAGTQALST